MLERLIGKKFNDTSVQSDLKLWPFTVKQENDKCLIEVTFKNELKTFQPGRNFISILTKMKETAKNTWVKKLLMLLLQYLLTLMILSVSQRRCWNNCWVKCSENY